MNSASKNILRAALAVHNKSEDDRFIAWVRAKIPGLKESSDIGHVCAMNEKTAFEVFLRIIKPKTDMAKEEKVIDHTQRAHALLSASGASRWMNCTPSARLEENFENKSSSFAEEGTLAHEFAELNLKLSVGQFTPEQHAEQTAPFRASEHYSEEMEEYVQKHIDYVTQQFTEAKRLTPDAVLLIEERVDITHLIEDGFGTCDIIIIADGVLEVIDLKYGLGVRVSAENNSQLKLYGSGALEAYEMLYDIHTVRLTITQPRMDSISSWEISAEDLRAWGEDEVKPKAEQAYAGDGEQVVGDHCRFCKASARCKAQEAAALEATKHDFQNPMLLTDEELVEVYKRAPNVEAWLKSVGAFMYDEALAGKVWPEHKLVDGQNRRGWTDEKAVALILKGAGVDLDKAHTVKLKGIGDIEKLVGKKEFPTLLSEVVANKKTSPSLVHISDKRPAMGVDQAKTDFAEDL